VAADVEPHQLQVQRAVAAQRQLPALRQLAEPAVAGAGAARIEQPDAEQVGVLALVPGGLAGAGADVREVGIVDYHVAGALQVADAVPDLAAGEARRVLAVAELHGGAEALHEVPAHGLVHALRHAGVLEARQHAEVRHVGHAPVRIAAAPEHAADLAADAAQQVLDLYAVARLLRRVAPQAVAAPRVVVVLEQRAQGAVEARQAALVRRLDLFDRQNFHLTHG
jgi:hypothetical protein